MAPSRPISLIPASELPKMTIQIPFVLLGRQDLDRSLYNHEERHNKPIETVYKALRQFCPNIPLQLYIPLEVVESKMGDVLTISKVEEVKKRAEKQKMHEEKRREELVGTFGSTHGWILRRADTSNTTGISMLPGWGEGDGLLTEQEQEVQGDRVWACDIVLQRVGLQMRREDMEDFERQMNELCNCLKKAFIDFKADVEIDGQVVKRRWWSIVCGERCNIKVCISPPTGPFERGGAGQGDSEGIQHHSFSMETVTNLLLLMVAFERELMMLSTPSSLLRFWPLSRFLEKRGIRALREEKQRVWRYRTMGNVSEKRRGKLYGGEKKSWVEDMGRESEVLALEKKRTWWEAVVDVIGEGEIGELVRDLGRFEKDVGRLGISFVLAGRKSEEKMRKVEEGTKEKEEGSKGSRRARDMDHSGDVNEQIQLEVDVQQSNAKEEINSSKDKTDGRGIVIRDINPNSIEKEMASLQLRSSISPPIVTDIVFQGHRSTLDAKELVACTELVSKLVHMALSNDYESSKRKVKEFRHMVEDEGLAPIESFKKLMTMLSVSGKTADFWMESLCISVIQDNATSEEQEQRKREDAFTPLETAIHDFRIKEKAYVSTLIQRYDFAGGFHITPHSKLHQLMQAEDRVRERKMDAVRQEVLRH